MKYRISSGMRAMARHLQWVLPTALAVVTTAVSLQASATPIFARQTGQNCQACHVGGQFPELTPYGRMFKLTGYTLGQRTKLPLAVMGVFSATQEKNVGPAPSNGAFSFNTASLFAGGKITDNIGFLAQYTYNASSAGSSSFIGPLNGQAGSDNTDFRYANRIVNNSTDLVYGVTLNNNPGVEDVWNSSPAWGYGYVPGSNNGAGPGFVSPILNGGLSQQAVGAGAYVYWDKTVYAELSGYQTGNGVFSFLTQGHCSSCAGGNQVYVAGTAPYFRLALTHDWGNSNAMIGYTYFAPDVYENAYDSGLYDSYRDNQVDFQYQYILDPNTVTVEMSDINETVNYGSAGSVADINSLFRAKVSYTYEAKYGGSLAYFSGTNSLNNATSPTIFGNGTSGWVPEIFWIPVQNVRIGYQYTFYNSVGALDLNGTPNFYDTAQTLPITKPGDYNTSFLYVWAAF